MQRAALLLVLVAASCTRVDGAPSQRPTKDAARQAPEPPCTLATPLVPGVPGSPGHLMPSERNPNGASELAVLMRTMERELGAARTALGKGERPAPLRDHFRKIRCSWPTKPGDRDASFDAFAVNYLQAVAEFDAAPKAEARPAYDRVLTACRSCHEQSCSGAIPAIEALRLPKAP